MLAPAPVPAPAPLGAPLTTTHRVISYTYPSTPLRTGDSLYRLITATYSTGESYHYTYPSTSPLDSARDKLRTGDSLYRLITATYSTGEYYHYTYDPVGNRLSLTTTVGVVNH